MTDESAPPESAPPESEASTVYRRLRRVFGTPSLRSADARKRAAGARHPGASTPFGAGREPTGLDDVMDSLTTVMGWSSPLARGELLSAWSRLVGDDIAARSQPVGIEEGVLSVQCDSTAWATQLRMMQGDILTSVVRDFPDAGVTGVRVLGPGAPSWKRGPRSVPGRGPRDTYG